MVFLISLVSCSVLFRPASYHYLSFSKGHPFHAFPSLDLLGKVDPRWAAAYFKSQFRNPAAFRFVFVGTMDPEIAVPLMHK